MLATATPLKSDHLRPRNRSTHAHFRASLDSPYQVLHTTQNLFGSDSCDHKRCHQARYTQGKFLSRHARDPVGVDLRVAPSIVDEVSPSARCRVARVILPVTDMRTQANAINPNILTMSMLTTHRLAHVLLRENSEQHSRQTDRERTSDRMCARVRARHDGLMHRPTRRTSRHSA